MILLLLLVEVMVLCLFYLIYRQLLIQLIMIIFFCILEKYVGICGNALKLIKSYFSNRTQRVQIDDVLSDFANIICGFRTFEILFVLIAIERDFEVSSDWLSCLC